MSSYFTQRVLTAIESITRPSPSSALLHHTLQPSPCRFKDFEEPGLTRGMTAYSARHGVAEFLRKHMPPDMVITKTGHDMTERGAIYE